jgi:tetratricopeptide (TPR) repeat protein
VLVAGRLDKVGSRYDLSLDLVSPVDGRLVATDRRSVDRQARVVDGLAEQANWARRLLGERSAALQSSARFERVTTSSTEALKLYSAAMELGHQFKWAPAAKLLEAAVARDPSFASAHILLAHALSHVGQPWTDVLRHAERAREHAGAVSEVERYFIEGSAFVFEANVDRDLHPTRLEQSAAAYEALLRLEPHHYWATNNLMYTYERLGRVDDATPLAVALGSERPNDLRTQVIAARALTAWLGDLRAAAPFVSRAQRLVQTGIPVDAQARGWLGLFEAHRVWNAGNAVAARREIDRIAATLPDLTGADLEAYSHRVGNMYLALGRCDDAYQAFERMGDEYRHEALALGAYQCDDHKTFVTQMLADVRADDAPSYVRVALGPRTGRLADAESWITDFRQRFANRLTLVVAEGELAAARGDWATAARQFEIAWTDLRLRGQERTPMVAERLADAHLRLGRPARALEVLEATVPLRAKMYELTGLPGGLAWIRAQVALARLYRTVGRPNDAARVEATIRPLLSEADPDLPLLQELGSPSPIAVSTPVR